MSDSTLAPAPASPALSPALTPPAAPAPEGQSVGRTLTAEQRAIVLDCAHHLMVDAGAGSGKTFTVIEKLMYEQGHSAATLGLPPQRLHLSELAAITFTRKATGEIKERLRHEFLRRARATEGAEREHWAEQAFLIDQALIGTIDAFAARLLRDYGALAGLEGGCTVLEPGDATALIGEVAEAAILAGIDAGTPGALFLVRQFGFLRGRGILADMLERGDLLRELAAKLAAGKLDWAALLPDALTRVDKLLEPHARALLAFAVGAYDQYVARCARDGVMDHTQVILQAGALAAHPDVQAAFRARCKLLIVDEHQDTNLPQVQLLFRLAGLERGAVAPAPAAEGGAAPAPACRLVMVGDPKQGIYGFRYADITLWTACRARLLKAGGRYYELRGNHRSRPTLNRFFDDCFRRLLVAKPEAAFEVGYGTPLTSERPETPAETPAVQVVLAEQPGAAAVAEVVAERVAAMLRHPDRYPVFERQPDGSERAVPLRPKHIAILARKLKGSADLYERALKDRGIDAYVYGGRGLYSRQEVQDLANLLRAVADPHDPFALIAFLRSPLGGLDDLSIAELAQVSSAAARGTAIGSLYDALRRAPEFVADAGRAAQALQAATLLEKLRGLRDRLPHDQLLEVAIEDTRYRAFLAGAPDAPAGIRNVEKLLRIARRAATEPLAEFVRKFAARVRRADPEDEAPLYSSDDDLVTISTIHKAKGLEWPVVIVTGLDEELFFKVRAEEPKLSARFGVALSLDVVLTDGATQASTPETSAVWAAYAEDQTRREYAEAKRLFYVACTRARDHLLLAGALVKPRYERHLDPSVEWMHKDGCERWLRHLYRPLTESAARGGSFAYGDAGERAPIRRGLAAQRDALLPPPADAAADAATALAAPDAPASVARQWPAAPTPEVLAALRAQRPAWPATIARQIRAADHTDVVIRDEFTASELLKFRHCRWQHRFSYRGSVSSPTIETTPDDAVVNQVLPEKRGDILHDYLEAYDASWTQARAEEEMKNALLRHLNMSDEAAAENVAELLRHADHYLASAWYRRVQGARAVARELPFAFAFDRTREIRFTGKLDLVFTEADGDRIVDFKTGLFRGLSEAQVRLAVAQRREEYEVQAAVYALALEASRGPGAVRQFVFFFTSPDVPNDIAAQVIDVTPAWFARWRAEIGDLVEDIRASRYGADPVYEEAKCRTCELIRLCRPEGAPAEALVTLRRAAP